MVVVLNITTEFLDAANMQDSPFQFDENEAVFNQAIARLNQSSVHSLSEWKHRYAPITYLLMSTTGSVPTQCRRSAALIEALHAHALLDQGPKQPFGHISDLGLAAYQLNYEAFETLLLRCDAHFATDEILLRILFRPRDRGPRQAFNYDETRLQFLRLMCRPHLTRLLCEDPDVALNNSTTTRETALQRAVGRPETFDGFPHTRATDPNPLIVRALLELGAKPLWPLQELTAAARLVEPTSFGVLVEYYRWRGRVDESLLMLQLNADREEREIMIMMALHPRLGSASPLRILDAELLRGIARDAHK
jgi:hypothetical protein